MKIAQIRSYFWFLFSCIWTVFFLLPYFSIREKCQYTELFLVRIFLYSNLTQIYFVNLNKRKYGPEICPNLDTSLSASHAFFIVSFSLNLLCSLSYKSGNLRQFRTVHLLQTVIARKQSQGLLYDKAGYVALRGLYIN